MQQIEQHVVIPLSTILEDRDDPLFDMDLPDEENVSMDITYFTNCMILRQEEARKYSRKVARDRAELNRVRHEVQEQFRQARFEARLQAAEVLVRAQAAGNQNG